MWKGHTQLARSMLDRITAIGTALAEFNREIADALRPWDHQVALLQTIPGLEEKIAQVIIAETGADMNRSRTPAHLASWAGVAPAPGSRPARATRCAPAPQVGSACWMLPATSPIKDLGPEGMARRNDEAHAG